MTWQWPQTLRWTMSLRNKELKRQHGLPQYRPYNWSWTCKRNLVQKSSQNSYICTLENVSYSWKAKLKHDLKIKTHQFYYNWKTGWRKVDITVCFLGPFSKERHSLFKVRKLVQVKSFPSAFLHFLYTNSPTLNPLVRDDWCLKYFKQIPCSSSDLLCVDFAASWSPIYGRD